MGKRGRFQSEEAIEREPELAAEPAPEAPVSMVVTGAAALDPLANGPRHEAKLAASTWCAAKRMRAVECAAFLSWVRSNTPDDKTPAEWAALLEKFQTTPIK